ncbi:MAG TPA: TetR/AcrR family transcriptional regulator [Candidatus Binatia bacterium]|nr:TetR/AcrR family transcriptional regulator [Candidatus Binatia bacterium]
MTDTDLKPRRGEQTRKELMDLAEIAILEKGYAATSIDELIAQAGITKSGFFYHFGDKLELAKELLRRDNATIEAGLQQMFEAAEAAHPDPLDALLETMTQYAQAASASPTSRPGCLAAAFSYQHALFDEEMQQLVLYGLDFKRRMIRERLERAAAKYPPRERVDLDALADMAIAIVQGAMIMDRVRDPPPVMQAQMDLYRTYLRAIFAPRAA